MNSNTLKNSKI